MEVDCLDLPWAPDFLSFPERCIPNTGSEKFPVGWEWNIVGFITVVMILIPVTFYLNGPKLQARSKYAN